PAPGSRRSCLCRAAAPGRAGRRWGARLPSPSGREALADAAEAASFPVFEVPYVLPFIAITEAVFTRLVAEQYDLLSRSLDAEHTLTRAVLEGQGPEGVVSSLTSVVGGWAILLDVHGVIVSATPPGAKSYARRIWGELHGSRPEGIHFRLALVGRGQNRPGEPVSSG